MSRGKPDSFPLPALQATIPEFGLFFSEYGMLFEE